MKNTVEEINNRLDNTEEHISDLEDRKWKSPNHNSKKRKNKEFLKNEKSLRDLWNKIKHTNICIIGVPEEEEREEVENVFDEIMVENFSDLKKETDIRVQETQRVPNKMNPNRLTLRHIIRKTAKLKTKREF